MNADLKLATEVISRDDKDNQGPRVLRPGLTDEYKLATATIKYATALREAASIGVASLFAYCGAYESLNKYKRDQWDRLNELHAMCDCFSELGLVQERDIGYKLYEAALKWQGDPHAIGQLDEAIETYRKALLKKPNASLSGGASRAPSDSKR